MIGEHLTKIGKFQTEEGTLIEKIKIGYPKKDTQCPARIKKAIVKQFKLLIEEGHWRSAIALFNNIVRQYKVDEELRQVLSHVKVRVDELSDKPVYWKY